MKTCEQCSASILEGSEFILAAAKKEDPDRLICQSCAATLENAIDGETRDINIFGAVGFGLVAAVISAIIWYAIAAITNYKVGIVAIGVGWLVAQAVIRGAGRKRGPVVQLISVIAIIFAMGLGEYLIIRHFLIKAGFAGMPLFLPFKLVVDLLIESIKEDPQMLIFWLIALIEGVVLPARRKLKITRPSGTPQAA